MTLTSIVLALSTVLSSPLPAVTPAPAPPAWCPEIPGHRVECGTLDRPLIPGKTVTVGYARVLRQNEAVPAKGTIMVNPGGPGGQAIAQHATFTALLDGLLADHDLLLVDPRGVGRSTPLTCGVPASAAVTEPREKLLRLVGRCGSNLGPRAGGYTSAATADDLNAVRAALGIPKVVLYGISYGTYLLPVYAQRHPGTVQSVVLSAAYPIDLDPLGRESAQAVSSALRRICERGGGACDGERAVRDLARVAARLRAVPLGVPLRVGDETRRIALTEDRLAQLVYSSMSVAVGAAPSETPAIGRLPRALYRAARGDDRELAALAGEVLAGDLAAYQGMDMGIAATVSCNDYPRPWPVEASVAERRRRFERAVEQAGPGEFGAFSARGFATAQADAGDYCLRWPAKGTGRPYVSTGRFPDVPVLVLNGDLDGITAEANGRRAAAQFARGVFLPVPNVGHVPEFEPSGCVAGIVTEFVREGGTGDTSCLAAIPPVKVVAP
ncbi:alpha/beta fold hydrolase [Streptosporangium sp. NPDC051022]|uniref:alpha/beta fold hydrolase n=1 Tax=Streptosporangium sp. NPDC051022 TaxID=3155752 RepID=UPI00343024F3